MLGLHSSIQLYVVLANLSWIIGLWKLGLPQPPIVLLHCVIQPLWRVTLEHNRAFQRTQKSFYKHNRASRRAKTVYRTLKIEVLRAQTGYKTLWLHDAIALWNIIVPLGGLKKDLYMLGLHSSIQLYVVLANLSWITGLWKLASESFVLKTLNVPLAVAQRSTIPRPQERL